MQYPLTSPTLAEPTGTKWQKQGEQLWWDLRPERSVGSTQSNPAGWWQREPGPYVSTLISLGRMSAALLLASPHARRHVPHCPSPRPLCLGSVSLVMGFSLCSGSGLLTAPVKGRMLGTRLLHLPCRAVPQGCSHSFESPTKWKAGLF